MTLLFAGFRDTVALWLAMCGLCLLGACANFNTPPDKAGPNFWQGRLAVNIASVPAQAFSANFALEGSTTEGVLALTSVLGTRVATLRWDARAATLQTPQERLSFESVDAMLRHSLGAPLPLAVLFGWLQGDAATAPGWEVDLRDLSSGRIRARRLSSDAAAEIKIILEPG